MAGLLRFRQLYGGNPALGSERSDGDSRTFRILTPGDCSSALGFLVRRHHDRRVPDDALRRSAHQWTNQWPRFDPQHRRNNRGPTATLVGTHLEWPAHKMETHD